MRNVLKNIRKSLFVECDCMDISHLITFEYFDESEQESPDGWMYIGTTFNPDKGFFTRFKYAFMYLFGFKKHLYSMFSDSVIFPEDVKNIREFLDEYDAYIQKNDLYR